MLKYMLRPLGVGTWSRNDALCYENSVQARTSKDKLKLNPEAKERSYSIDAPELKLLELVLEFLIDQLRSFGSLVILIWNTARLIYMNHV